MKYFGSRDNFTGSDCLQQTQSNWNYMFVVSFKNKISMID